MLKKLFCILLIFVSVVSFAQDKIVTSTPQLTTPSSNNKETKSKLIYRFIASPELIFVDGGAVSKGSLAGVTFGIEVNKTITKNFGLFTGLLYSYQASDRFLVNDPFGFSNSRIYSHAFDIPLGIKLNTNRTIKNNSLYFALAYINEIGFASTMANLVQDATDYSYSGHTYDNQVGTYNPGFKTEFGIQSFFNNNNSFTIGLSAKQMYLNSLTGKGPKISTLGIGFNLGYIF